MLDLIWKEYVLYLSFLLIVLDFSKYCGDLYIICIQDQDLTFYKYKIQFGHHVL